MAEKTLNSIILMANGTPHQKYRE